MNRKHALASQMQSRQMRTRAGSWTGFQSVPRLSPRLSFAEFRRQDPRFGSDGFCVQQKSSVDHAAFFIDDPGNYVLPVLRAVFAQLRHRDDIAQSAQWPTPRASFSGYTTGGLSGVLASSERDALVLLFLRRAATEEGLGLFESLLRDFQGREVNLDEIIESCAERERERRCFHCFEPETSIIEDADLWTMKRLSEALENDCYDAGYFDGDANDADRGFAGSQAKRSFYDESGLWKKAELVIVSGGNEVARIRSYYTCGMDDELQPIFDVRLSDGTSARFFDGEEDPQAQVIVSEKGPMTRAAFESLFEQENVGLTRTENCDGSYYTFDSEDLDAVLNCLI
ncbi:MAG: hypothetical protein ACYCOU_10290 [Sulfobacillus sp.]